MAGEHPSIEQPYVLVVEGRDEVLFFEALLARCGIGGFQVLPANGKDNIRPVLQAVVRSPGFARLVSAVGVVRDADDDGAAAFRSVCGALSAAGLACPSKHCEVVGAEPRVSVLIMPDGVEGELETLSCVRSPATPPAPAWTLTSSVCGQRACIPRNPPRRGCRPTWRRGQGRGCVSARPPRRGTGRGTPERSRRWKRFFGSWRRLDGPCPHPAQRPRRLAPGYARRRKPASGARSPFR